MAGKTHPIRWRAIALAIAAGILLGACSSESARSKIKPAAERHNAPDFALKDENGKTVHLSDYRGKVVLLNFWATWCEPCKIEIPWFMDFERRLKGQGFAVLGVSMDEDGWQAVKPFISERGVNYRILLGNDTIAQLYGGIEALPTTFIIDRDGRIAATHQGLVSKSRYENDIKQTLEAQQSAGLRSAGRRLAGAD